eukprot:jgi/Bigna1/78083/fgenesh1_pg.52_\
MHTRTYAPCEKQTEEREREGGGRRRYSTYTQESMHGQLLSSSLIPAITGVVIEHYDVGKLLIILACGSAAMLCIYVLLVLVGESPSLHGASSQPQPPSYDIVLDQVGLDESSADQLAA